MAVKATSLLQLKSFISIVEFKKVSVIPLLLPQKTRKSQAKISFLVVSFVSPCPLLWTYIFMHFSLLQLGHIKYKMHLFRLQFPFQLLLRQNVDKVLILPHSAQIHNHGHCGWWSHLAQTVCHSQCIPQSCHQFLVLTKCHLW